MGKHFGKTVVDSGTSVLEPVQPPLVDPTDSEQPIELGDQFHYGGCVDQRLGQLHPVPPAGQETTPTTQQCHQKSSHHSISK